jgi:hypothetical protein
MSERQSYWLEDVDMSHLAVAVARLAYARCHTDVSRQRLSMIGLDSRLHGLDSM